METNYRKALEPHVGKDVTIYPNGLDPIEGTLTKGPMFYSVRGKSDMLILISGHPVLIKSGGLEIDLSKLRQQ